MRRLADTTAESETGVKHANAIKNCGLAPAGQFGGDDVGAKFTAGKGDFHPGILFERNTVAISTLDGVSAIEALQRFLQILGEIPTEPSRVQGVQRANKIATN